MDGVRLSVCPQTVLVDEKVSVRVFGLDSRQNVTVYSSVMGENGVTFVSWGCFQATTGGTVYLDSMPSSLGTYTGVDGMGFIWSMVPSPGQRKGVRLLHSDVTKPQLVDISIYNSHHSLEDLWKGSLNPPLTKTVLTRWYKSHNVRRLPIMSGKLQATLFLPKGNEPFPGVIDIVGLGSHITENRAALLASHGFAVITLSYKNKDFQSYIDNLDLQHFQAAVTFMDTHPCVRSGGLGIMADSKGTEYAQFIALGSPLIKCMVRVNGIPYVTLFPIRDGDILYQPVLKWDLPSYSQTDEGVVCKNACCFDTEKFTKIWETDVKILCICGTDDLCIHPDLSQMLVNCFPANKRDNIELVTYKGTGHLIEPPFSPHCRASYNKLLRECVVWGGNPTDHAYAQEDSWRRILQFFYKHFDRQSML